MLTEDLPPLYAAWVTELLGAPIPRETEATCATCPQLPSETAPPQAKFFDPTTKCCTFMPKLWNFLVGRALREPDSAGRASVVARIERGEQVTPFGLFAPRSWLAVFQADGQGMGRNRALRCPHYLDDGRCGVWTSRESTCATYFCRHVRGKTGSTVWRLVGHLLAHLEQQIATACVADRAWNPARAADYYLECAAHLDTLSWPEVRALGGDRLTTLASEISAVLTASLPTRLRKGDIQVVSSQPGSVVALTYNGLDPTAIPSDVARVLDRFDGRPNSEVLAAIEADDGIVLEPAMLRRLVDFAFLVEANTNG